MPTATIQIEVTSQGRTPFTLDELAEVTSYLQTALAGMDGAFGDIDLRVTNATAESFTLSGETTEFP